VVGLVDQAAAAAVTPRQLLAVQNARAWIALADATTVLLDKLAKLESALVSIQGAKMGAVKPRA
jgi:hypothetical protein